MSLLHGDWDEEGLDHYTPYHIIQYLKQLANCEKKSLLDYIANIEAEYLRFKIEREKRAYQEELAQREKLELEKSKIRDYVAICKEIIKTREELK